MNALAVSTSRTAPTLVHVRVEPPRGDRRTTPRDADQGGAVVERGVGDGGSDDAVASEGGATANDELDLHRAGRRRRRRRVSAPSASPGARRRGGGRARAAARLEARVIQVPPESKELKLNKRRGGAQRRRQREGSAAAARAAAATTAAGRDPRGAVRSPATAAGRVGRGGGSGQGSGSGGSDVSDGDKGPRRPILKGRRSPRAAAAARTRTSARRSRRRLTRLRRDRGRTLANRMNERRRIHEATARGERGASHRGCPRGCPPRRSGGGRSSAAPRDVKRNDEADANVSDPNSADDGKAGPGAADGGPFAAIFSPRWRTRLSSRRRRGRLRRGRAPAASVRVGHQTGARRGRRPPSGIDSPRSLHASPAATSSRRRGAPRAGPGGVSRVPPALAAVAAPPAAAARAQVLPRPVGRVVLAAVRSRRRRRAGSVRPGEHGPAAAEAVAGESRV